MTEKDALFARNESDRLGHHNSQNLLINLLLYEIHCFGHHDSLNVLINLLLYESEYFGHHNSQSSLVELILHKSEVSITIIHKIFFSIY